MTKKLITAMLGLWLGAAGIAFAETKSANDPLAGAFISPEVVMSHQKALGISTAQRDAIQAAAEAAQQRFTHAQFELAAAAERFGEIVKANHIDETKALAQLDSVLDHEREVKRAQITLMIAIKNQLTPEQQAMARQFGSSGEK